MSNFGVIRTTTDKLEDELNKLAEAKAPITQTEYLGGRDWVIIHGQSENDPWHPKNIGAGTPGVFQAWMCGVWPSGKSSGDDGSVPCLYQRGHTGRHHYEPHKTYDAPQILLTGDHVMPTSPQ